MNRQLARAKSLWRNLTQRSRVEDDLDAEMQSYLSLVIDEKVAHGVSPERARREALLEIGGIEPLKEKVREAKAAFLLDSVWQDVRFAVRSLRRNPGLTVVALFSLSIGIGVNASLFSLVDRLVMTSLPVREPDRLRTIYSNNRVGITDAFSFPDFVLIRDGIESFEGVFASQRRRYNVNLSGRIVPVQGEVITGDYFDVLGVRPAYGRLLTRSDDQPASELAIVISHRFWESAFSRDPGVVGQTVRIDLADAHTFVTPPFRVAGIAPRDFWGTTLGDPPDIFLPFHALKAVNPRDPTLDAANAFGLLIMGRLKHGVTDAQAAAELWNRFPNFDVGARSRKPGVVGMDNHTRKLRLRDGRHGYSNIRTEYTYSLVLLMALVAIVLMIACANLANLLLVRTTARVREIGARLALGASQTRLIRQWLTESLVLSAVGAILGIGIAFATTTFLLTFIDEQQHSFLQYELSGRNVAFTALMSGLTGLVFGILPALRASRIPMTAAFTRGAGTAAAVPARWLTRAVVVLQVAVSLCLVTGAGLFTRTLLELNATSGGFDRRALVYADIDGLRQYPNHKSGALFTEILAALAQAPEVASAGSGSVPLRGRTGWGAVAIPGYTPRAGEATTVFLDSVSPGFFRTMGIPILAGRGFEDRDRTERVSLAIVNETFANRFFKGRDAVGQQIRMGAQREVQIVGVVRDVAMTSFREPPRELVYHPMTPTSRSTIVARPAAGFDSAAVTAAIERVAASVDPTLRVRAGDLERLAQTSFARERLVAQLSGGLAVLGLILASIGLYGVMAFGVTVRTAEIGVRIATGAEPFDIMSIVLRETVGIAAAGIAIGVPVSIAAAQLVRAQLFAISPSDPASLAFGTGVLLIVALAAGYLPARRASRLDPVRALRYE